jgi:hypothetical protein
METTHYEDMRQGNVIYSRSLVCDLSIQLLIYSKRRLDSGGGTCVVTGLERCLPSGHLGSSRVPLLIETM